MAYLQTMENCGFQSWVDEEWPDSLKDALQKLWAMYYECKSAAIEERDHSSKMVKDLTEEKDKIEKKYADHVASLRKWVDDTERRALAENMRRIYSEDSESQSVAQMEKHLEALNHEIDVLKNAKEEMKNLLRSQADVFKGKQNKWQLERDGLMEENKKLILEKDGLMEENKQLVKDRDGHKEEKKKLEYTVFDMFQHCDGLKEKLKKIKEVCDE